MTKILIFISCILAVNAFGQNMQTKYLKANGKETSKVEKAEFTLEVSNENGAYHLKKYTISGRKLILDSEVSSLEEPYLENGMTTYLDPESGSILAKGSYSNGELAGEWIYRKNREYDTVTYEPYRKAFFNAKDTTYVIVEEMPLFAYNDELIEKRKPLDQKLHEILAESNGAASNDERYLAVQRQIIELNSAAFNEYKADHQCYPLRAKESGIKGIVYAGFVIDEQGKIVETRILKGINKDLDAETMRLINSMSSWKAGKQKGKAVRVAMTAGIKFE